MELSSVKFHIYDTVNSVGYQLSRIEKTDYVDFKYQPFPYTLSGNDNYYTVGAKLVNDNLILESGINHPLSISYGNSNKVARLYINFRNADTNSYWGGGGNSAHMMAINSTSYTRINDNLSNDRDWWKENYEYFMYIPLVVSSGGNNYFYEDGNKPVNHVDRDGQSSSLSSSQKVTYSVIGLQCQLIVY